MKPLALLPLGMLVAIAGFAPMAAHAQATGGSVIVPAPKPMPTIGGTPLPYPAYGTPAPDVAGLQATPGIPASVSLDQAVKISVALSPVFAQANAEWAEIHAKYTSEKQALFPAISGNGSLGNTYQPYVTTSVSGPNGQRTELTTGGKQYAQSLGLQLSQLVYDGGRTIAAIHSAKSADFAGRATLLRNLQTLTLNVANTYYAVLQTNATVTADAQLVKEFEVNEAAIAAQIRNGAAARSDIAAAQFQTAQARGNLVTAQGQAIAAQSTFATTLGLNADVAVKPKETKPSHELPPASYATSVKRALLLRPDYLAAQYTVESDKEGLRYAKLARFPVLGAQASYDTSRSVQPLTQNYGQTKTLGLNLTIPIYDQGLTNYNVAVAAATLDIANAALRQTGLQVQSDVRSSLANLISARSALEQADAELRAAKVSLDATQAQYRVGASTVINVATAEANLSTAQADQIRALYGVQTALETYLYATGTSDLQL